MTLNEAAVLLLVNALERPTTHLSAAPEADGKDPQSTDATPDPGITAVATAPTGN